MSRARSFTASASKRLDLALTENGISRSQAKSLIEKDLVKVNGQLALKAGQPLEEGDLVEFEIPAIKKLDLTPADADIRVLYEDDHLAVVEKPAGISVHPSTTESGTTLVHALLFRLKSLSSVGGIERPGIVHRIDKGTSGILVVSKTDAAHLGLARQFKDHSIDRRYLALVYGDLAKLGSSGKIETFYGRNPKERKKMTSKLQDGRKAITHWKIVESFGKELTLVECRLETGRTHQVRVHLAELEFPVVGDPLYVDNRKKAKMLKRIAVQKKCFELTHQLLHACKLEFQHPVFEKKMSFTSEVPLDFKECLAASR